MGMSKFEAILPLTEIQESLLLHRLFSNRDKGELHVRCDIDGNVEVERFERAWQEVVNANQALRTTIHWKDIKRPVQIIHPTCETKVEWIDALDLNSTTEALMGKDEQLGLDISALPSFRIKILKKSEKEYRLLLYCHHILLDGWSSVLILKDLIKAYDLDQKGSLEVRLGMKAFLGWSKRSKQDETDIKDKCKHFCEADGIMPLGSASSGGLFENLKLTLSKELVEQVNDFSKTMGISLNNVYQAAWAILLHGSSQKARVAFGTTVSGRMNRMTGIDGVTGMLTNVVPVFSSMTGTNLKTWLNSFQNGIVKSVVLESHSLRELHELAEKMGAPFTIDTLFTFENFPWENIEGNEWVVSNFKGGMTSNYPISISVLPADDVELQVQFDTTVINQRSANGLMQGYVDVLTGLTRGQSLEIILQDVNPVSFESLQVQKSDKPTDQDVLPANDVELQLLKIWQRVLNDDGITVRDDFFSMGGKSVQALQIFSEIQKMSGKNLSPATLLENRTVRSLAVQLSDGDMGNWSSLVPLNISGDGAPLFCIHAGGAHVFIYRELAELFENERPVFGIQPFGLDEGALHNQSIKEMTETYLREIKSVVGDGPINVLGYCFSAAIVAEMIQILSRETEQVLNAIIVDSAPGLTYGREKLPVIGRLKKLVGMFSQGQWARIKEVVEGKWDFVKMKYLGFLETEQMRNFRKVEGQLAQLYTNYEWKESSHNIDLIRSSEFANRSDKDIHLEEWRRLQGDHLNIHVVKGKHNDLFTSKHVNELATKVRQVLMSDLKANHH